MSGEQIVPDTAVDSSRIHLRRAHVLKSASTVQWIVVLYEMLTTTFSFWNAGFVVCARANIMSNLT